MPPRLRRRHEAAARARANGAALLLLAALMSAGALQAADHTDADGCACLAALVATAGALYFRRARRLEPPSRDSRPPT